MHKINIKLFAVADTFEPSEFLAVFHRWIQEHALPDHLLIDVADYAHVPDGPGTLLVSSQANIHMDRGDGRLGLLYVRKQHVAEATDLSHEIVGVLQQALKVAALIEAEPSLSGRLKFRRDEISVRFNDRLATPNSDAGYTAIASALAEAAKQVFGAGSTIEHAKADPAKLLEAVIHAK